MTKCARASASAVLGLALAGCGVLGAKACTDMGAESGITFEFGEVLARHPDTHLVVKACVVERCETLEVDRRARQDLLTIGRSLVTDDSPVPVTLTVTGPHGGTVYRGHVVALPVKRQPNGPGCPPSTWWAHVTASGTSDLRQVALPPA